MENYLSLFRRTKLFENMDVEDIKRLIGCLATSRKSYKKGETILYSGDLSNCIGFILSGGVNIIKEDYEGNIAILARAEEGELFAEAFSCGKIQLSVSVTAAENTDILWFDYDKVIRACNQSCTCHREFLSNLMQIFARKNIFLTERIDHLSKRTLREKVISYLSEQAQIQDRREFTIPFDRQGLAAYLASDRSALSAVLSKLKEEGIIDYSKNRFKLL